MSYKDPYTEYIHLTDFSNYKGCSIINIRRNPRTGNIHATVVDKNGQVLICATLDYILQALNERIQVPD